MVWRETGIRWNSSSSQPVPLSPSRKGSVRPVTDLAELVPGHRGPLQVLLG
jgi:hypothetical protein